MGGKRTNSPSNEGSSSVQIFFMARTRSCSTRQRVRKSVPWSSISSAFHPAPMPKRTRPLERKSRLATSFAVTIGSRSITRQMPVATFSRVVTAAAVASATNGSWVCQYSLGSVGPPGHGLRRDTGMCVCSGSQSDSKPRSSAARARSSTRMA
jgi:hypothetical protein